MADQAEKKPRQLKVLVIRFSSIGDIVLTTPVIRCLKKIPGHDVEVHYATKHAYAGLLSSNPYVDSLHLLDGSLSSLTRELRTCKFDYIIDLHNNLRSLLIKLSLGRPSKSFRKLNVEKWMLTRLKINRLPDLHIVDRYMEAATALGVVNDGEGLDYFLPEAVNDFPEQIPQVFRLDFIAASIGGNHATKRLPVEQLVSLCSGLTLPVILLGGREDSERGEEIAKLSGSHVFNACGLISLNASAFLVKKARLVISHDTGLMHIAAAFKKPLISVWGNTVPAFGMYPYMPGTPERYSIVEVKGLACRPCSKIGYQKCPKEHFDCMKKIDIGLLADEVNQMLEKFKQTV